MKGTGTVVTGTVWSGELPADSIVRVLPAGAPPRAPRRDHPGVPVAAARAVARSIRSFPVAVPHGPLSNFRLGATG